MIGFYDMLLNQLELFLTRQVKHHDSHAFYLLRSVPGIGKILALTILYEIHHIARLPRVQEFVSLAAWSSAVVSPLERTRVFPAKRSATFT